MFYLRTKIAIRMNLKIKKNQQLKSATKYQIEKSKIVFIRNPNCHSLYITLAISLLTYFD